MHVRMSTFAVFLLVSALPAGAQQSIKLQFNGGQVTLSAQNAPVRVILAEWARLGGATIVNGDRVAGPPVTLELTGVPERQALDIVLRSVAGYMLAPRRAGSSGASEFDRILILPSSVAPRNPPPAVAAGGPRPVVPPRPAIIARQPEAGLEVPIDAGQEDPVSGQNPPVFNQPLRPGDPRVVQPPFIMRPPIQPGVDTDPDDTDDTDDDATEPDTASPVGVGPTPANPFGIPFGSSATPGAVTPAPQPQQQQQRPPGPNRVQ